MYALDISETSIELVQLQKNLLGHLKVRSSLRVTVEAGEKWSSKLPKEVFGKRIAYTIPDSRVFLHRFVFPDGLNLEEVETTLLKRVQELIPEALENLVYSYQNLSWSSEKINDVLFVAVHKETLGAYEIVWRNAQVIPILAVPESLAVYELFRGTLTPNEFVLYVDIGAKYSTLSFFDGLGPWLTLSEPVETEELEMETHKAIDYFERSNDQKIEQIILGGGGSLSLDPKEFQRSVGTITISGEKVLREYLDQNKIQFRKPDSPLVLFLGAIGLGLLSLREKEYALNLQQGRTYSDETISGRTQRKEILRSVEKPFPINKLTEILHGSTRGLPQKVLIVLLALLLLVGLITTIRFLLQREWIPFSPRTTVSPPNLISPEQRPPTTIEAQEREFPVKLLPTESVVTATVIPTPTFTLVPTPTETPKNLSGRITADQGVNLRSGPGTAYRVIEKFSQGTQVIVVGKNEEGTWFEASSVDGRVKGWIWADYLEIGD